MKPATDPSMVRIQTDKFGQEGEFGWRGAVKRSLRLGSEVLIEDYRLGLQEECQGIEAELQAEGLNVKFWPAEQVAKFIFWPPLSR